MPKLMANDLSEISDMFSSNNLNWEMTGLKNSDFPCKMWLTFYIFEVQFPVI